MSENKTPTPPRLRQVLVTLPGGAQIMFQSTDPEPYIKYRPSLGGSWGLAFPVTERPHEECTIYIGEW